MTPVCHKSSGTILIQVGFWPDLLTWSFKTDPIFSRFFGSKNHITRRIPFRPFYKNFMIFHVSCSSTAATCSVFMSEFRRIYASLYLGNLGNFSQLFSACHYAAGGLCAKITPRERPCIQANAICLNTRALLYLGKWDPECHLPEYKGGRCGHLPPRTV